MKLLQAPKLKTIALTKAISTVICSSDKQAFDNMRKESEKEIIAASSKSSHG